MYRGGYLDHGGLPERPGLAVQTSRHVLSEQAVQSLYLGGGDGDQSCFALLCFALYTLAISHVTPKALATESKTD